MPDPQHIVEQIQAFVASTDETRSPELAALADTYAALCSEANARLRRCRDYLRRGLRAEAIHEADEAPALLDVVAVLDIPEAANWSRACVLYELTRPPPLLMDAANELNQAYAAVQPLRALLEKHRRFALQCAPLAQRIAVMRELAAIDPNTPFWEEDLQVFESARLRELSTETTAAVKASDRQAVARLREEVGAAPWRISVPIDLQSLLDRTDTAWRQEEGDRAVRQILPDLDTAYSAMDFDQASGLLRQIKQIVADTDLDPADDLVAKISPVKAWVSAERQRREKHRRFEAACDQLSLALEADAPEPELERLRREATALEPDLPPELAQKLRQAAQKREAIVARRVRRSRWIVAGIVTLIVVSVGLVVRATLRDRWARTAYTHLSALIGAEHWDEAQKAWDLLPFDAPGATDRADFQQLHVQLDTGQAREHERQQAFASQMQTATAKGPENPDSAALAEAELLAKTEDEKQTFQAFAEKVATARREARQKQLDSMAGQLASLGTETDRLEKEAAAGRLAPTNAALSATETALTRFMSLAATPAEAKQSADAFSRRLKTLRATLERTAAEREAMLAITQATSASELKDALLAYVQRSPDSPHAAAFKQAVADAPAWEAVDEGAKLIDAWDGKLQAPSVGVPQRAQALAAYAAKYPESPFAPAFENYRSYLAQQQQALASDGPWRGELSKLLNSAILKDVKCIRTVDGKVYYLPADATPQNDSLGTNFNAILSGDVSNTRRIALKPSQIKGDMTESPQAALSRELLGKLGALNESNWETFGLDVIDDVLLHKEVDPILRVILLSRCAKLAQAGTWGAGDVLKALDTVTSALNADDIAWMNPTDVAAREARVKAQSILDTLSPLKELRAVITTKRDAMFKAMRFKVTGHAVLMKDGDGWTVLSAAKATAGQQAWAVQTENGHRVLNRIGGVTDQGKLAVDPDAVRGISEGAMVFVIAGT